jgi:hypothetical protein
VAISLRIPVRIALAIAYFADLSRSITSKTLALQRGGIKSQDQDNHDVEIRNIIVFETLSIVLSLGLHMRREYG